MDGRPEADHFGLLFGAHCEIPLRAYRPGALARILGWARIRCT